MDNLIIYFKSLVALFAVWFADILIVSFASLLIFSPETKEVLANVRDLIGIVTSLLILVLTVIKIRKANKNKDEE